MPYQQIYSVVFIEKKTGLKKPVYDCETENEANHRCHALNEQHSDEEKTGHYVVMRGNKEMRFTAEKKESE